jgi:hypothetical protein
MDSWCCPSWSVHGSLQAATAEAQAQVADLAAANELLAVEMALHVEAAARLAALQAQCAGPLLERQAQLEAHIEQRGQEFVAQLGERDAKVAALQRQAEQTDRWRKTAGRGRPPPDAVQAQDSVHAGRGRAA